MKKMINKIKINKKSQAAMEFLMTYGWAILVVLVAVGALAYFGVLSPDKFLPQKCLLQSGIGCLDSKATSIGTDNLQLYIQNALGYDINLNSISAAKCTAVTAPAAFPFTLSNGATTTVKLTCGLTSGSKYNGGVGIVYTNIDTQIQHTNNGSVTTRVE